MILIFFTLFETSRQYTYIGFINRENNKGADNLWTFEFGRDGIWRIYQSHFEGRSYEQQINYFEGNGITGRCGAV